jgi:Uri superfamily endonuclease
LPNIEVWGALIVESNQRIECSWASWIHNAADHCVESFGSSDCACPGHLFFLGLPADMSTFIEMAAAELNTTFIPRKSLC